MIELSDFEFETLCDDGEFVLSRIERRDGAQTWLAVTLSALQPAANSQGRLEHAYELRGLLEGPLSTRPHALIEHRGSTALILEDPSGISLSSIRMGSLPFDQTLRVARNLAAAIADVHERGLVHRDIRPVNILVDPETGGVALTGFGFASRLTSERAFGSLLDRTAAALPYLAPEQTGRMDRKVDSRADLYSLGLTLYEMFSGGSPYRANSPIEWIHCHIARTPIPLDEVVSTVPAQVGAIVMRLLAKTAEDRYQTARGLENDLLHCLDAWRRTGRIEPFALGSRDMAERLTIPERLYGRETEAAALHAAFERVARQRQAEFVLVSGYSGVGKTSLVNELQKRFAASGARFACGKFDQYKRDIPYATLAQAFQSLIGQILQQGDAEVARWRRRLSEAVLVNGQQIINLIPDLEKIIGPQPIVAELSAQDAQVRFQAVFARFIGAFAQANQPLVLFLDDLQWLDAGTLSLLESLLAGQRLKDLLFVGAYRDNEVGPAHPLARASASIRAANVPVHDIVLTPLQLADVSRLVGEALHADQANLQPLASVIFEKAGGNPFFTVQFLQMLADEHHLVFDPVRRAWDWDIEALRAARFSDSVVDLMVGKIKRVSQTAQVALKQFACFGNVAATAMLARVAGVAEPEVHAALADAVKAGLVYRREQGYAFLHDRVQEAAYALILADERADAHLRIGRMFAANANAAEREQDVFEIVNQYNRALNLIDNPAERERVVEFNLAAGRRAKRSSAYVSASTYFAVGSALLDSSDAWQQHYPLKFSLESGLAECEFLGGETEAAKERLASLSRHAATLPDRAVVAWLRVTLFTALDQSDRAVEICLEYLRDVGFDWGPHPTREEARLEYDQLLQRIGETPIESLIDLPLLTDTDRRATLDVLTAVLPPAFFSDENLVCLVLCRMANLSLEHGNSDASSIGYSYLGMVAGPVFGDYEAGYRFGRLGLSLVDERGLQRFKPRVYMCFAYHVTPWTQPIRTGLPLLRRAFEAATENGDLTYMGFSSCCLITTLLAAGEPLADVEREAHQRLGVVQAAKFGLIVDIISSQLQLIRSLRGLKPSLDSFNDESFDESAFETHLEADSCLAIATCWYWIRKLQARYFAGNIEDARESATKAAPLLWTSSGHFEIAEYHFYAALTRARRHDEAPDHERVEHVEALVDHHTKVALWAEHCPSNFGCRAALIAGEIARLKGNDFEAMGEYENAIRLAREHEFPLVEALAHEIGAEFYLARGFPTISHAYFGNARLAYLRWGALGKVQQLDRRYPNLVSERANYGAIRGIAAEQFDVETVVRASQAISGEIAFEKLIRTLMTIVLEYAGAGRALLVLPRGEALWIEAEALGSRDVEVRVQSEAVSSHQLPTSILHHSMRTRQRVLLDDASLPNPFSTDEYFRLSRARAVLCLPLAKQGKLIGVLYLENDLAPGAFTPPRIAVLELLASQAAISLENATLEEKEALLEEKEALLHEVHHRVKNNLQLISSLLNLQAARVSDKAVAELFADSRNRVRSMALVHENLYRAGNFARIAMAAHVRNLCGHLARAYDTRHMAVELQIEVDELQLDMNRAVSCGLIINELVSNALKHAFPGGRKGCVRIELGLVDEDRCKLTVADDGVGIAPAFSLIEADSFGLQLVYDLTHQLHGTLVLSSEGGTVCSITFNANGR